mgnify:CR=1 FL=1
MRGANGSRMEKRFTSWKTDFTLETLLPLSNVTFLPLVGNQDHILHGSGFSSEGMKTLQLKHKKAPLPPSKNPVRSMTRFHTCLNSKLSNQ